MKLVNIYNNGRQLYLFCRDESGKQVVNTVNSFFPYFYACVDDETEALTSNGWKNYKEISLDDKIATFDMLNNEIIYHKPYKINIYDYDGKMININTPYFSQCLTPNHKILIKHNYKHKKSHYHTNFWRYIYAKDLLKEKGLINIRFPIAGKYDGDLSIGKEKAKLLGWIITEGSLQDRGIKIKQSYWANKKKVLEIKYLLKKLKIKFSQYNYEGITTFYLSSKQNLQWIFDLIDFDKNKTPSYKLLHLKQNEQLALFNALIDGDGYRHQKKAMSFYQKNQQTLDWFKILCCHLGYRTRQDLSRQNIYIYPENFVNFPVLYRKKNKIQYYYNKCNYKGKIWCPSLPNKTWIARRNGKIFITGNSDPEGTCKGYKGESLRKILVSKPSDVRKNRNIDAYEADIIFTRRYMIDKVDKLEKCPIKYAFIDIEVLSDELPNVQKAEKPVSCISVYNSLYKDIQTFYLEDYESEFKMIEAFIEYMKKEKFDLWLSWNVKFDYNYLHNRFPDFAESVSVIGKSRYGDQDILYPAGISIIDYLAWFKKVTMNRERIYSLDAIAQKYLGEKSYEKINFGELSNDIVEKNRNDVSRMAKLEEQKHLIDYFDEIRRLTKVEWEDMIWNSRIIDMLLLEEAKNQKVVLPMKPDEKRGTLSEKEDFEGAYREAFRTGANFNIGKYDLASAYPEAIINFCLDPGNIVEYLDNKIVETDMTLKDHIRTPDAIFLQNERALLPTVAKKIMTIKNNIKKELKALTIDAPEYKDMKTKYEAIKTIVNSTYGVMGNRFFRLYDKRVASATTFIVRDLLHYVKDRCEQDGHKVIYVDTDSIFVDSKKVLTNYLNNLIQQWAKDKYNKSDMTIEFDYEGHYEKLLIFTKCRYKGYLRKTNGKLETETKGIEAKRKDSTEFMKTFQTELIDKILNKEPKEEIFEWIKNKLEEVKETPLKDISFPCKLGREPEAYKNCPIFLRALKNTENFEKKVGDPFYYIFMEGKDESKKELVMAFDENTDSHINRDKINWDRMIDRNITMKLATIFEAMGWNVFDVIPMKEKKPKKRGRKKKEPVISLCEHCNCMTKTVRKKCGKCKENKEE